MACKESIGLRKELEAANSQLQATDAALKIQHYAAGQTSADLQRLCEGVRAAEARAQALESELGAARSRADAAEEQARASDRLSGELKAELSQAIQWQQVLQSEQAPLKVRNYILFLQTFHTPKAVGEHAPDKQVVRSFSCRIMRVRCE